RRARARARETPSCKPSSMPRSLSRQEIRVRHLFLDALHTEATLSCVGAAATSIIQRSDERAGTNVDARDRRGAESAARLARRAGFASGAARARDARARLLRGSAVPADGQHAGRVAA